MAGNDTFKFDLLQTVVLYNYGSKKIEDKWSGHEREITKVLYHLMISFTNLLVLMLNLLVSIQQKYIQLILCFIEECYVAIELTRQLNKLHIICIYV